MYLHLGQDCVVRDRHIVGIFDLDTTTVCRDSRDFLQSAEQGGRAETVSYELPKSFVLCAPERRKIGRRGTEDRVYISQLSSATLKKRAQRPFAVEPEPEPQPPTGS